MGLSQIQHKAQKIVADIGKVTTALNIADGTPGKETFLKLPALLADLSEQIGKAGIFELVMFTGIAQRLLSKHFPNCFAKNGAVSNLYEFIKAVFSALSMDGTAILASVAQNIQEVKQIKELLAPESYEPLYTVLNAMRIEHAQVCQLLRDVACILEEQAMSLIQDDVLGLIPDWMPGSVILKNLIIARTSMMSEVVKILKAKISDYEVAQALARPFEIEDEMKALQALILDETSTSEALGQACRVLKGRIPALQEATRAKLESVKPQIIKLAGEFCPQASNELKDFADMRRLFEDDLNALGVYERALKVKCDGSDSELPYVVLSNMEGVKSILRLSQPERLYWDALVSRSRIISFTYTPRLSDLIVPDVVKHAWRRADSSTRQFVGATMSALSKKLGYGTQAKALSPREELLALVQARQKVVTDTLYRFDTMYDQYKAAEQACSAQIERVNMLCTSSNSITAFKEALPQALLAFQTFRDQHLGLWYLIRKFFSLGDRFARLDQTVDSYETLLTSLGRGEKKEEAHQKMAGYVRELSDVEDYRASALVRIIQERHAAFQPCHVVALDIQDVAVPAGSPQLPQVTTR